MRIPRIFKKSQSTWFDLAIFAGVLAFLAYSLNSFLAVRALRRAATVKPTDNLDTPDNPSRAPASQSTSSLGSTEVIRLPCFQGGLNKLSSQARLVQIHAPLCPTEDMKQVPSWHASNESSGEEILVFVNRKEKILSTSYFNLQEGANNIVFVQDLGKGRSRVEKLLVERKEKVE
ncbi:MAG TPA: hypothetical protein VIH99_05550 [Bdellovibrionota bacterium]|jgi:hypothetical protein